ncbi:MAG: hydrolase, partial [Flavobacteriaceae bacterium]
LPIGDNFTMGMEEAAMAAKFIDCETIVGCHYDSFPYIKINQEKTLAYFNEKGVNLLLPKIGETLLF